MANDYINKVVLGSETLIDLTSDTVTAATLMQGYTAHDASGATITGTAQVVSTTHTATITNTDGASASSSIALIEVNNQYPGYYADGAEFTFNDGDALYCRAFGKRSDAGYLYVNGVRVAGGTTGLNYSYTPPSCDLEIRIVPGSTSTSIYITFPSLTITANGTYDVSEYIEAVVNVPSSGTTLQAKTNVSPTTSSQTITADAGYDGLSSVQINAMPSGTAGTPTASKGTVSNHSVSVTPSVTNTTGYITGGTHAGTPVTVQASELVSGTKAITGSGTTDVTDYASASVAAGSATASATKGSVSNHSVTVTPSVTRTAGWVTAGTANGTPVTVSASELVSGSETKTANGTYDVTDLAEVVVDVPTSGATNFVHGEFTTQASAGVQSVSIPYAGSGYPIMAYVVVKGGAYVSGTDWYNAIQYRAIGMWAMSKSVMSSTPTYGTSGTQNQAVTCAIYKGSTSSATSYTRTSAMNTNTYSSSDANNTASTSVRFKSSTSMSVYVNTSGYGLCPETDYEYFIVYSE